MIEKNNNGMQKSISVTCVTSDGVNESYFDEKCIELNGNSQRMLSEQMAAVNFRLRTSDITYASDWHAAGDPTLLIILSGCIEIELRSGEIKRFSRGEMFVAEDYLAKGVIYNENKHGHRAKVIGSDQLQALHLKLNRREA